MIAFLKGVIKIKTNTFLILEVDDVGYKIFAPQNVLENLNQAGEPQELFIHHYVSEDREELYGFFNFQDLELFELLMSVSGIGPKSALGVMAVASTDALKKAIVSEDTSVLTKVSGIGQKTAERVILELKSKLPDRIGLGVENQDMEVLDALVELGYPQTEARKTLAHLPKDINLVSEKIKWALRHLGK